VPAAGNNLLSLPDLSFSLRDAAPRPVYHLAFNRWKYGKTDFLFFISPAPR
jgi:hypothetical protein